MLAGARLEDGLRVRTDDNEEFALPRSVTNLLVHILTEMSHGNAVTIVPVHKEFTTQEAADYLNVSRPHVIKLLQAGKIQHHKIGTHRRIKFTDLQDYKEKVEAESKSAMDELVSQAQEEGMGY